MAFKLVKECQRLLLSTVYSFTGCGKIIVGYREIYRELWEEKQAVRSSVNPSKWKDYLQEKLQC